ncbi:uncharacterized protein LOC101238151 isoform X2 [Hydra vulgaris]|uniref:uncharacterized protein LOC101238151 isoform X2 n=1 Tax=Hydra vulgaris TaxID=6087 RepID=UPI0032EA4CAB
MEDLKSEILDILIGIHKCCDTQNIGYVKVSTLILILKEKAAGSKVLPYLIDLEDILDEKRINPYINQNVFEEGMKIWIKKIKQQSSRMDGFQDTRQFSYESTEKNKMEDLKSEISDILIGIFKVCDKQNHGYVRVSTLVLFLKEKAAGSEVLPYLNDLVEILDKKGVDPFINQMVYEKGMKKWIKKIKKQNLHGESFPDIQQFSYKNSTEDKKFHSNIEGFSSLLVEERKLLSVSSTYSNDSTETSDLSWDSSDCQLRLEELEITNKRLLEENIKLKRHLNTTEDQNILILQENEEIRKQLVKFEKISEDSRSTFKKHEKLKANLVDTQISKAELLEKMQYLERENHSLYATLQDYESKILLLDNSLLQMKEDREKLSEEFNSHKECTNKSDYMSSVIVELTQANELLKAQKNIAENEICELKQEINRFSMMPSMNMVSTPLCSSTKIEKWPLSLQQELKLESDSNCADYCDFSDSFGSNLSESDHAYSNFAFQCRKQFRLKKEQVVKKLDELICVRPMDIEETSMIVEDLNMELDSLTEKITEFAQGRQAAEKKAQQLVAKMKRLKDENLQLHEARDKAMMKFGDLSMLSVETETKMHSLMNQLGNAHLMSKNLEIEQLTDVITKSEVERDGLVDNHVNLEFARKIFEMEKEISAYEESLKDEKKKVLLAQEKIHETEVKHSRELQALYNMVSKNTEKEVPTYDDVMNELTNFLKETKREINKLLGVRKSPEGYSTSQCSQFTDPESDFIVQERLPTLLNCSSTREKILSENTDSQNHKYVQTDIDMLKVNLCYNKFEVTEQITEVSERNNSINSMNENYSLEFCSRQNVEENNNVLNFDDVELMKNKSFNMNSSEKKSFENDENIGTNFSQDNPVTLECFPNRDDSAILMGSSNSVILMENSAMPLDNENNPNNVLLKKTEEFGDCTKDSTSSEVQNDFDDSSENNARRRRHGISAEPARVSWNTLRDSFKVLTSFTESPVENSDFNSIVNSKNSDLSDDSEPKCNESVQSSTSSYSLPVIEVQDEDEKSLIGSQVDLDSESNESSMKNVSLKVPRQYENLNAPYLIPSKCEVLIEDEALEKMYQNVVFSFNTDQFTLQRRLENQERARDVAERGMDKELEKLRHEIKKLISLKKGTQEYKEAEESLNKQCDILQRSAMKISAQSEQHGCYQHENLVTSSHEIMIAYVEHLKERISKLNKEIVEHKRRFNECRFDLSDTSDVETKSHLQYPDDGADLQYGDNITADGDNAKEAEEKTKSNKFSVISKSLVVTKRLKRRNLEPEDTPNKRVSFDTTPVSDIKNLKRKSGDKKELEITTFYSNSFFNTIKKQASTTIIICLCVTFLLYAMYLFVKNAFEIDTIRFHDILLRYIPHTIEYQNKNNEKS